MKVRDGPHEHAETELWVGVPLVVFHMGNWPGLTKGFGQLTLVFAPVHNSRGILAAGPSAQPWRRGLT